MLSIRQYWLISEVMMQAACSVKEPRIGEKDLVFVKQPKVSGNMTSLSERLARNWRLIEASYAHEAFVMGVLTLLYMVFVTEERWAALLAAWRPWSDRSLFVVGTFVVHETMYLGKRLCAPRFSSIAIINFRIRRQLWIFDPG